MLGSGGLGEKEKNVFLNDPWDPVSVQAGGGMALRAEP